MYGPRLSLVAAAGLVALLAFAAPAYADEVIPLLPHGDSGLNPPRESKPDTSKSSESSGTAYSPAEVDVAPTLQTRHFGTQSDLACTVGNKPGALVVVNKGSEALEPGTKIKWQLKDKGLRGYFALIGTLEPGATLVADGVVDSRGTGSSDCLARVI